MADASIKLDESAIKSLSKLIEALPKGKMDREKFESFSYLADGLLSFASIDWKKVTTSFDSIKGISSTALKSKKGIEALAHTLESFGDKKFIKSMESFGKLSMGLKQFGDIKWVGVTKGFASISSITLLVKKSGGSFKALSDALKPYSDPKVKKSFESFFELSIGLQTFAEIKWGGIIKGFASMSVLSRVIRASKGGFDQLMDSLKSLGQKKVTVEVFGKTVESLKTFSELNWAKIGFGLLMVKMFGSAFSGLAKLGDAIKSGAEVLETGIESISKSISKNAKDILIGTGLLALLAGATALMAGAFILFAKVDWESVFLGITAILALGLEVAAMGLAFEVLLPGIGILALLAGALLVFGLAADKAGKGMQLMSEAFQMIATNIQSVLTPLLSLAAMSPMLFVAAAGITAVSLALAGFAIGQTGNAISGFFGKMLGVSSPFSQLHELADLGPGLEKTASALEKIRNALVGMPTADGLKSTNESLKNAINIQPNPQSGSQLIDSLQQNAALTDTAASLKSASAGQATVIDSSKKVMPITNNVSSVVVNQGWMPDRSTMLAQPAF
jgi:hypothetical protein